MLFRAVIVDLCNTMIRHKYWFFSPLYFRTLAIDYRLVRLFRQACLDTIRDVRRHLQWCAVAMRLLPNFHPFLNNFIGRLARMPLDQSRGYGPAPWNTRSIEPDKSVVAFCRVSATCCFPSRYVFFTTRSTIPTSSFLLPPPATYLCLSLEKLMYVHLIISRIKIPDSNIRN